MLKTDLSRSSTALAVEISFPAGLPGFPDAHRFELAPWGPPDLPFLLLSAADESDVAFVVAPPWGFYPDYEFDLDQGAAERLGISEPTDSLVFCVVTLRDDPADATVNLLGPIVVNRYTLEAAQVAMPSSGYSVDAPLTAAS
jgi:flagellar assembly factor FliW